MNLFLPYPAAMIGAWELLLIMAIIGVPASIAVVALLVVRFANRKERRTKPPPLPKQL